MIDARHDIKRDETFEQTLKAVRDSNKSFPKRYEALSKLYDIVNVSEGIKGKTSETAEQRKNNTEQKRKFLGNEFQRIQELLQKAHKNGDKTEQARQKAALEAKQKEAREKE